MSVAYLLYLPYLSQKSVGEWSERSVDIFTTGGLGGFHCEGLGSGVTDHHLAERGRVFSVMLWQRNDASIAVTFASQAERCDSRPTVRVIVGAIRACDTMPMSQ